MPNHRRAFVPGGTFFFTVVTHGRRPILCDPPARNMLRLAVEECRARWPFTIDAFVLLPEHLHAIWTLPDDDADFSRRWALIKKSFARQYVAVTGPAARVTAAQRKDRRLGVWQPRFWEHAIADPRDFEHHFDYVHHNPIRHGLVRCVHEWPTSTFHRFVKAGVYDADWGCCCEGRGSGGPNFPDLAATVGE